MLMRLLSRFIIRILANSVGIFIAAYFVPGIIFRGNLVNLLIVGFALALANTIIKPILKFVSGPLIILTMGLFMIIINIIILWLVAWLMPELTVIGFWAYFWGVLTISIINAISQIARKKSKNNT